jgi:nucleotide-binding universal stress UspA family protein
MLRNLVLAYDGSRASERAFERALDLAHEAHTPLHVVAVAWTAEVETRVGLDKARLKCLAYLEALCERGRAAHVELQIEVAEGDPSDQIVIAADRIAADLLVIGHRRRNLLCRMAEASVAKRVIDRAHCPVLVAN